MSLLWCPLCEATAGDWEEHSRSRRHLEARAASPFPGLDVYPEPCDGVLGPATRAEIVERSPFLTFADRRRLRGLPEFEAFGSVERK